MIIACLRRNPLVALFVFAFVVKAILLFVAIPQLTDTLFPHYGIGFADDYEKLAMNLVEGNGYRFYPDMAETLMREPGYPLLLAAVFKLFGYNIEGARLVNLLLTFGTAWLVLWLVRKFSRSDVAAFAAVSLFFFHPGIVIAEARGSVEMLFTFLLVLFVALLYRAVESGKRTDYILAGGLLGLAVLVRSTPVLFPVFLLGYAFFVAKNWRERRERFVNVGLLALTMFAVMTPWIVRNYTLVNEFVPTASVQGVSAHAGQYICKNISFDNGFHKLDLAGSRERAKLAEQLGYKFKDDYYQYFYSSADEVAFNKSLWRRVVNEYREEPSLFIKCTTANLVNFWFAGKSWRVTWINVIVQLPYLVLAIMGAFFVIRRGRGASILPLILLLVYVVSVHAPIAAQARYSIPLVPFLAILAGIAIGTVWERRRMAMTRRQ